MVSYDFCVNLIKLYHSIALPHPANPFTALATESLHIVTELLNMDIEDAINHHIPQARLP